MLIFRNIYMRFCLPCIRYNKMNSQKQVQDELSNFEMVLYSDSYLADWSTTVLLDV